jgi:hypothetical protein
VGSGNKVQGAVVLVDDEDVVEVVGGRGVLVDVEDVVDVAGQPQADNLKFHSAVEHGISKQRQTPSPRYTSWQEVVLVEVVLLVVKGVVLVVEDVELGGSSSHQQPSVLLHRFVLPVGHVKVLVLVLVGVLELDTLLLSHQHGPTQAIGHLWYVPKGQTVGVGVSDEDVLDGTGHWHPLQSLHSGAPLAHSTLISSHQHGPEKVTGHLRHLPGGHAVGVGVGLVVETGGQPIRALTSMGMWRGMSSQSRVNVLVGVGVEDGIRRVLGIQMHGSTEQSHLPAQKIELVVGRAVLDGGHRQNPSMSQIRTDSAQPQSRDVVGRAVVDGGHRQTPSMSQIKTERGQPQSSDVVAGGHLHRPSMSQIRTEGEHPQSRELVVKGGAGAMLVVFVSAATVEFVVVLEFVVLLPFGLIVINPNPTKEFAPVIVIVTGNQGLNVGAGTPGSVALAKIGAAALFAGAVALGSSGAWSPFLAILPIFSELASRDVESRCSGMPSAKVRLLSRGNLYWDSVPSGIVLWR